LVAELKSHVLVREEKGAAGIPFKRLLLAGVGGGLVYTLGKVAMPDSALLLAVATGLSFLFYTAPRGGIPRWQRMLYRFRSNLLLAARDNPDGLSASIVRLLDLPLEEIAVRGETAFAPPTVSPEVDFTEWVTFAYAADVDTDDGLVLVDSLEVG
jgi:hypothetical protein